MVGVRLGGDGPGGGVRPCDVGRAQTALGLQQRRPKDDRVERHPLGEITLGAAVPLAVPPVGSGHWSTQYDVSPDPLFQGARIERELPRAERGVAPEREFRPVLADMGRSDLY